MTIAEVARLEALQQLGRGHPEPARQSLGDLQLSVRQVKRLWRAYRQIGATSWSSRGADDPPNRRVPKRGARSSSGAHPRSAYSDFGPTFASEASSCIARGCRGETRNARKAMIAAGFGSHLEKPAELGTTSTAGTSSAKSVNSSKVTVHRTTGSKDERRAVHCCCSWHDANRAASEPPTSAPAESTGAYFELDATVTLLGTTASRGSLRRQTRRFFNDESAQQQAMTLHSLHVRCKNFRSRSSAANLPSQRTRRARQTVRCRIGSSRNCASTRSAPIAAAQRVSTGFIKHYNERFLRSFHVSDADAHRPLAQHEHLEQDLVPRVHTFPFPRTSLSSMRVALPHRRTSARTPPALTARPRSATPRRHYGRSRHCGELLKFEACPLAQRPVIGAKGPQRGRRSLQTRPPHSRTQETTPGAETTPGTIAPPCPASPLGNIFLLGGRGTARLGGYRPSGVPVVGQFQFRAGNF